MAEDLVTPASYLNTRLSHTSRAPQLTPSMQFDLARSALNDDQLETVTAGFGSIPHQWGWGLAGALDHLLTSAPKTVPVNDIKTLQDRLKEQGYLPPDYVATGLWDPTTFAGFRRHDRDNAEQQFNGASYLSVPFQKGINAIGWTLPSSVFQGIVGMAKGLMEQAPETAERVGAIGGAVGGALIGAAAGSVVPGLGTALGAGVGAVIGGVGGFFGDLLSQDEGEGDQDPLHAFLDALTPYDEYRKPGGFKAFMEDLTTIAVVAGTISGVGGGIGVATKGIAGISEAESGAGFLAQSLAKTGEGAPGWFTRIAGAAAKRSGVGADRVQGLLDFVGEHGLQSQLTRPLIGQVVNPLFSGLSESQFLARAIGNLAQGDKPSTLSAAIQSAPKPGGTVGTVMDLASFVIMPQHFLPFRASEVVKGVDAILGEASLAPGIHVMQSLDPSLGMQEGKTAFLNLLGRNPAEQASNLLWLHLNHGVDLAAANRALNMGLARDSLKARAAFNDARRAVIAEMNAAVGPEGFSQAAGTALEAARTGKPGAGTIFDDVMSGSFSSSLDPTKGPWSFAGYMLDLAGKGSGVERLQSYFDATKLTNEATVALHKIKESAWGGVRIERSALEASMQGQFHPTNLLAKLDLERQIKDLETLATKMEGKASKGGGIPGEDVKLLEQSKQVRMQEIQLRDELKRRTKAGEFRSYHNPWDLSIVPEKLDTPTSKTYRDLAKSYDAAREKVLHTFMGGESEAHTAARLEMQGLLDDLVNRGIVPSNMAERAMVAEPTKAISRRLSEMSRTASQDVSIGTEGDRALEALGYKATAVGRDNLLMAPDPHLTEVMGLGDYTRRRGLWESLGLGVDKNANITLARLRQAHLRGEVTSFVEEARAAGAEFGISAESIMRRLYASLSERGKSSVVTNDAIRTRLSLETDAELGDMGVTQLGSLLVARDSAGKLKVRLPAIDLRDLTRDDVATAFSDVAGFTDKHVQELYGAIRRGSAYGQEMVLRNPLEAAHTIGRALRVNGMPGFADVMRTWHIDPDKQAIRILGSVTAGAIIGGVTGDDKIGDAIRGAAIGGASALMMNRLVKKDFGYLPDSLVKLNSALRYSLSPAFDVRRYTKQTMLAAEKYDLPLMGRAQRYISKRSWNSMLHEGETVTGADAWAEARTILSAAQSGAKGTAREAAKIGLADDLARSLGIRYQNIDDIDRTLYSAGILGYSPMERQAAHAYQLAQRGMDLPQIRKAMAELYTYGFGRSNLEKTINYVFFPFSFEKKIIQAAGDFVLQGPGRNLLINEGLRRYQESKYSKDVQDFLERHLPLLTELGDFNAFAHGLSPGRFFLEGTTDNRTLEGKAANVLSAFFVPAGGSGTGLYKTAGSAADLTIHAFTPIVLSGESVSRLGGDLTNASGPSQLYALFRSYVPFVRDLQDFWENAVTDQIIALTQGEGRWSQYQDYNEQRAESKASLEPLALAMGYSGPDGLMSSKYGQPFKDEYQAQGDALAAQYPTGFQLTQESTNFAALDHKAFYDIQQRTDRTPAEAEILKIYEMGQQFKLLGQYGSLPADIANQLAASSVRQEALRYGSKDKRFVELWNKLFLYTYGPLTMTAGDANAA